MKNRKEIAKDKKDKKDNCFHLKDGIKLARIITTAKKERNELDRMSKYFDS